MPPTPSLRLSYGPGRDLSATKSIIGILIILHGLAGALVATLITEGRTSTASVSYLPGNGPGNYGGLSVKDTIGKTCERTVIYAGQYFDEKISGASFDYTALNSFTYGGEELSGCTIDASVQPTIIVRPPVASPTLQILDLTVICNTSVSIGGARFAPSGSSGSLEGSPLLSSTPGGFSAKLNVTSTSSETQGYLPISVKIYQTNGTITTVPYTDPLAYEATSLTNELILDIKQDFDNFNGVLGGMVLLPNVLFPCTETKTVWKNAGDVFWYCVVAVAAVFAPLYMFTVWALTSEVEKKNVNNALNANAVRRNSGLSRIMVDRDAQIVGGAGGVDQIPMSPTSPRITDAHVVDLADNRSDQQHDPDYKPPLPSFD